MDNRVEWLCKQVCRGLGVTRDDFATLFSREKTAVHSFLDEQLSGASLLFYSTSVDGEEKQSDEEKQKMADEGEGEDPSGKYKSALVLASNFLPGNVVCAWHNRECTSPNTLVLPQISLLLVRCSQ